MTTTETPRREWLLLASILCASTAAAAPPLRPVRSEDGGVEIVVLQNHFVPGRSRRYHVTSKTTTTAGRQQSKNEILDEMLSSRPVPPVEIATIEFEEEELCNSISAEHVADVSYRCLSFHANEIVGEETVLDLRVDGPDDFQKAVGVPKYASMVGLMEAPIRFTIDPLHDVLDVRLPRDVPGALGEQLRESYRRNLESRYQAFFPGHPVSPGDEWTHEITTGQAFWSAGMMFPDAKLRSTMRLASLEQVKGRRCARLEVSVTLGIDPGTALYKDTIMSLVADGMKGTSTILFDVDEGTPVQEETSITFSMRRITGNARTEKIEVPIVLTQAIAASWVATVDAPREE